MNKQDVFDRIRGGIIVSCQANEEENPLASPEAMVLMARCAAIGGCVGFRANMPENVRAIKEEFPDYPMIGIWKITHGDNPVYITPDIQAVDVLVSLGCEIVAIDGTCRKNYQGRWAWEVIREAHEKYPDIIIMADIATLEDAVASARAGADMISTTMAGYTEASREMADVCDFELIRKIREADLGVFINAEGKIWSREDALKAFECGADCVVVGTAITNPMKITKRFTEAARNRREN